MTDCGVSATSIHPGGIKTAIARSARTNESIADLGLDIDTSSEKFERAFLTTPEKAARTILRAVQRDQRRVLVGPDAYLYDWMVRLLPARYQDIVKGVSKRTMR
jgi:short-subunit dehydrogenase